MATTPTRIAEILKTHEQDLLADWVKQQLAGLGRRVNAAGEQTLKTESRDFLSVFTEAAQTHGLTNLQGEKWNAVRDVLTAVSTSRAKDGFTPSETASFIFSFKLPLFTRLRTEIGDAGKLADEIWNATIVLDKLGLFTMEVFQKTREDTIARQQQELLELSTPVVRLWENVLALPLIGTLDSGRTQVVMQNLLEAIVATRSDIAIIDITGVPTVDTLVAQHLLKTVAAARLMGADCIISGIRPQIAQTIIHLGVDLSEVITKATMADAFKVALERAGMAVVRTERRPAQ
jgi:rsbT co-antagonist protein RsbR